VPLFPIRSQTEKLGEVGVREPRRVHGGMLPVPGPAAV
jgi:hypothetical protein